MTQSKLDILKEDGKLPWFITIRKVGGRKLFKGINFGETLESTITVLLESCWGYGDRMEFVSGRPASLEDF